MTEHFQGKRPREWGISFGVLPTGTYNAITDVKGVKVGQVTLIDDAKGMRTGVTAILPHDGNIFQHKVAAGIFLGNAFGKMVGYPQVKELGNIETPIVLTNTLNLASAIDGIIDYVFSFKENDSVESVNCVVGETIVRELYGGESPVGRELRIQNVVFKVIGVLKSKGDNLNQNDVGVKLDALLSQELLLTIFHPNTPLHDGAVILDKDKILYAGALLPLTEDPKLSWRYGTRHRAAIGITEISDCACIVVSEETGDVSIATEGVLKKYEDLGNLKTDLERILGYAKNDDDRKPYIFKFENILPSKYQ